MNSINDFIVVKEEIRSALNNSRPLVALETTVITHGLPHPINLQLADDVSEIIRKLGAVPAPIGLLDGKIIVGLSSSELRNLTSKPNLHKISLRDFAPTLIQGKSGGTTVAGTMFAATAVGIEVFATGGIGGVHRYIGSDINANYDISTDLIALSQIPMIVVCAGAKAILNISATLEVLETYGVPVVGYQTDEFPAFYSRSSGFPVSCRVDDPNEIAQLAITHWQLGFKTAVLVVNPIPVKYELDKIKIDAHIEQALNDAMEARILSQEVTPFLLRRVSELSGGASLSANLELLKNNAKLAAEISCQMKN